MAAQAKTNAFITIDEKIAALCVAADLCEDSEMVSARCLEGLIDLFENGDEEGRVFLGNAFSLQMLADPASIVSVVEVDSGEVPRSAISVIGHADTATVVSDVLGWEVPFNRVSIQLEPGDVLFVAQLQGGRLPEGATKLPDGFTLAWRKVVVR